jgi:hypothetical protein
MNEQPALDREALEELHQYYATVVRDNLDFCHKYLTKPFISSLTLW